MGCGTGNYTLAFLAATGCRIYGIDPSKRMLTIARQRFGAVIFVESSAEAVPFSDKNFDFVFSVDVVHHLQRPEKYIREAARVLKPGGRLCTVTESEELLRSRIPLASHFPETVEKEIQRYPSLEILRANLQASGFENLHECIVRQPYVIHDIQMFEDKAFSALRLIPEEAFQRGLMRLRTDLEKSPIQAVSHYLLMWGTKT